MEDQNKNPIFSPEKEVSLADSRIVRFVRFFYSRAGKTVIAVFIVAILGTTYYLTSFQGPLFRGSLPAQDVCPLNQATLSGSTLKCGTVNTIQENCPLIKEILKSPDTYKVSPETINKLKLYSCPIAFFAPKDLKIDAAKTTFSSVTLLWLPTQYLPGETAYNIYREENTFDSLYYYQDGTIFKRVPINDSPYVPSSETHPAYEYEDKTVNTNTKYFYRVTAVNKNTGAESPMSNVINVTVPLAAKEPPLAPTDITATAGDGKITLTWKAPQNSPAAISTYDIYRSTSAKAITAKKIVSRTSAQFSFTNTGLVNGTTYYYWLKSVSKDGLESKLSISVSATPKKESLPLAPLPPSGVKAETKDQKVFISWFANTKFVPITGFNVYRSEIVDCSQAKKIALIGMQLTYTDNAVQTGRSYCYFVSSQGKDTESELAGPAKVTVEVPTLQEAPPGGTGDGAQGADAGDPTIISTPENFKISEATFTKISLSWSVVSGIDGYHIYRDEFPIGSDGKIESKLFTVPAGAAIYDDTDGIQLGRKFAYQIAAYKGGDESEKSSVKAVEIKADCPKDNEYLPESQLTCKALPVITAQTQAADCTLYKSIESDPTKYGISIKTLTYVKQELSAKCAPAAGAGAGTPSGDTGQTGQTGGPTPKAPTGLTAKANGHIFLNWSDNKEQGVTYLVYKSEGQGIPPAPPYAKQMSSQKSELMDVNVLPGVVYNYSVVAVVGGVFSLPSNWASANILAPLDVTPPQAPTDVIAKFEPDGMLVSWKKTSGKDIAGYYVYRATVAAVAQNQKNRVSPLLSSAITAFKDLNVNGGETYYYAVSALDKSNNESKLSGVAQGTMFVAMAPGAQASGQLPATFTPGTGQMLPSAPPATVSAAPTFGEVHAAAPEEVAGTGPAIWIYFPLMIIAFSFAFSFVRQK